MSNQYEKVRSQFRKQAANFSSKGTNQTNKKYINWILDSLNLENGDSVLDVAAGTGILSRAIAQRVGKVTAIDLSSDMLEQGQIETDAAGIKNIDFVRGVAENLPFSDHYFDKVVCRLAFHHIEKPIQVLREMVRVCKRQSTVSVIDIISPEDDHLAESYNHYETLRDSSHVQALKRSEFLALFQQEGIPIIEEGSIDVEVDFRRWLDRARPSKENVEQITRNVVAEIEGGKRTGLRPFSRRDNLYFQHTFLKIVGETSA